MGTGLYMAGVRFRLIFQRMEAILFGGGDVVEEAAMYERLLA